MMEHSLVYEMCGFAYWIIQKGGFGSKYLIEMWIHRQPRARHLAALNTCAAWLMPSPWTMLNLGSILHFDIMFFLYWKARRATHTPCGLAGQITKSHLAANYFSCWPQKPSRLLRADLIGWGMRPHRLILLRLLGYWRSIAAVPTSRDVDVNKLSERQRLTSIWFANDDCSTLQPLSDSSNGTQLDREKKALIKQPEEHLVNWLWLMFTRELIN